MYQHFGVMLDVSRNAVMKVSELKKFIDCLQKMGYNTLELYAEDTYKLPDEPMFGYMRGGYTQEELREIDAYALSHGVELIPCVQTLAHFTNLVKIPKFYAFTDAEDILCIDEPETYELIEQIFKNAANCFTSRKINIGMDEAFFVGLGRYRSKHGYVNRFDLLLRHLQKVSDIAKKYGFTCHMWSDMFFRLCNDGEYYVKNPQVKEEVAKLVPDNIELVYWDYYHKEKDLYDSMFAAHKGFGKKVWFGGGAWTWNGFAPLNKFSLATMKPAMESVIEHGVKDVFITMWGDNGKECSFFGVLPSLYAIRQYADGNFDEGKIKEGFQKTFGYDFDTFMLLDTPNTAIYQKEGDNACACKSILYNDPFVGFLEKDFESFSADYAKVAYDLQQASAKMGEYGYLFECLSDLASVLDIKLHLGYRTRKAYRAGDKEGLKAVAEEFGICRERVEKFYESFRFLWGKENKRFGWEVQDARLGGLMQRLSSCKRTIQAYVDGKMDKIDELEEEVYLYDKTPTLQYNSYRGLTSPSEL